MAEVEPKRTKADLVRTPKPGTEEFEATARGLRDLLFALAHAEKIVGSGEVITSAYPQLSRDLADLFSIGAHLEYVIGARLESARQNRLSNLSDIISDSSYKSLVLQSYQLSRRISYAVSLLGESNNSSLSKLAIDGIYKSIDIAFDVPPARPGTDAGNVII